MTENGSGRSDEELLELIKMEPGEAFRAYPEELRKIRRDTDSERVKRLIDYVFEKYDINGGGGDGA